MLFTIFVGLVIFIVIYRFFLREPVFAYLYSKYCQGPVPDADKYKKENFRSLASLKSADEKLKKQGVIRILEVGPGTGVNFDSYPSGSKLVVVDSNPSFIDYFKQNKKKFDHIDCEQIITSKGEEMDMIADNTVDAVVMSHVMCSVDDVTQLLKHIYRVLAPGGKFYFFEHIAEYDSKMWARSLVQKFVTYSGIWPLFFVGCMLTRDPLSKIKQAGFKDIQSERVIIQFPQKLFYIIEPHLTGNASK